MVNIIKKKLIILLFLTISTIIKCQDFPPPILKTSFTIKNIYGVELGYINEQSIYQTLHFSLPFSYTQYMGYGVGYVSKKKFYYMGLIGITSDFNNFFMFGLESGFIKNKIIGSVFLSNTTGLGIKFGYIFK